ncbi:hypothetical protein GCM10009557_40530 [Virgisporangium ochraceum]|uniref:Uncharacterized protein n=1 Tax=Virgisporangium ochraceum TaxID=65505 RepID=A0A8J4A505_9ACTN|nr:hypothetical protein [Virgisporangium ochraceum]GIJ74333.1 hypothetical protein Voc01_092500 [Virgisporangium ochraceum]
MGDDGELTGEVGAGQLTNVAGAMTDQGEHPGDGNVAAAVRADASRSVTVTVTGAPEIQVGRHNPRTDTVNASRTTG